MMTFGSFVLQIVLAAGALFLAVYLPGRLGLRLLKVTLNPPEKLAAACVGGMALLTLVYWGLSSLGLGPWLWAYVLAAAGAEAFLARRAILLQAPVVPAGRPEPETWREHGLLGLLLLAGMLGQAWFMVSTGWLDASGMVLYAWHGHDAPWHVFNLAQMSRQFPPEMPGFAGEPLRNYHFFSDLFWAAILRLVPIDPWHVYLRVAPFWYGGLLALATFVAARAWSGRKDVGLVAAALNVFCSNFGYLLPLLFGAKKYFYWDSIFWVQSPLTTIFNPGVSSSYGLLLLGLWALQRWLTEKQARWLLPLALFWGVLPGFKVYAGLLAVTALLVAGLIRWLFARETGLLKAAAAVLPVFLLVFLPFNLHASSLVRLLPGFNLATMLAAPDRMALISTTALKLWYARAPLTVALVLIALVPVFLIGNLGVRSLGLRSLARAALAPGKSDPLLLFLAVLIAGALAGPVLFVQTGLQWNTIQFFYYAVLLAALPAAADFIYFTETWPLWHRRAALCLLLALGLPGTLQAWTVTGWGASLSRQHCEALLWLAQAARPGEVILRPLPEAMQQDEGYAQWQRLQTRGRMTSWRDWQAEARAFAVAGNTTAAAAQGNTGMAVATGNTLPVRAAQPAPAPAKIQPLGWMDTTIVAALTQRNTYLEDTVSAQITGYPVAARVAAVRNFYQQADVVEARRFLDTEHIRYVILDTGQSLPFAPADASLRIVFSNSALTIYKYLPAAMPANW